MRTHLFVFIATLALLLIGSVQGSAQSDGSAAMMSNEMISGFDPDAGLRSAQATSELAKRIEILARPGETVLELAAGGHRASAEIMTAVLPDDTAAERPDSISDPLITIGSRSGHPPDYLITGVVIRVDGCAIAMPWPSASGFADPRFYELGRFKGLWTLGISGSDGDEGFQVLYTFDDASVVAQNVEWGGSSYAYKTKIDEDLYGESRDCKPLDRRVHGASAQIAAPPAPDRHSLGKTMPHADQPATGSLTAPRSSRSNGP